MDHLPRGLGRSERTERRLRLGLLDLLIERLFNVALGLSIGAWALGHFREPSVVGSALGGLNLAVALLIVFRRKETKQATFAQMGLAAPAVLISGIAIAVAPGPQSWPLPPTVLLVAGCLFTLVAFLFLGRSFAILPALREVVAAGPYRLVRHPAYLGELLMLGAVAWAAGPNTLVILPVAAALVVIRIRAEEAVLDTSEVYVEYKRRTPHRLIPGLW